MKALCRYLALSELPETLDKSRYQRMVRPLDYEFDLVRSKNYLVISIVIQEGAVWFYVIPTEGDGKIRFVPAMLFAFSEARIPAGMVVRVGGDPHNDLEILPEKLASINGWFERYIDEDTQVVGLVKSEILRLSI